MRVLILTQYYPPEAGAAQHRLSDLALRLHRRGHSVTVLTSLPNYPTQEIFEEYRGRLLVEEEIEGIRTVRTWIYASRRGSFIRRLLNYWSFALSCLLFGSWRVGPQDVIIVELPPLFLGISGLILSRIKRAKCVINVSDLWLQSAVAMDVLRNKTLIKVSTWLEEFIYQHGDLVTGQTRGVVENIRGRFPLKQVELFTNGVAVEQFVPYWELSTRDEIRRELGWTDRFVVAYMGLHGLVYDLESVLKAAQRLAANREILFAFFGEGPTKESLMRAATDLKLPNVVFHPLQPKERIRLILPAADAAVMPVRRLQLFRCVVPAKFYEIMAAGLAAILCIDGEARELLQKANAGIYVEPEDSVGIADAVIQLYGDPELRQTFGRSGRQYVAKHFDRQGIAINFERLLLSITSR